MSLLSTVTGLLAKLNLSDRRITYTELKYQIANSDNRELTHDLLLLASHCYADTMNGFLTFKQYHVLMSIGRDNLKSLA